MPSALRRARQSVTITGQVAIEYSVQIGDRVLAQDADTGELAYKPVLGTTLRPPTEMVLVTTSDGEPAARVAIRSGSLARDGKAKELSVGDKRAWATRRVRR